MSIFSEYREGQIGEFVVMALSTLLLFFFVLIDSVKNPIVFYVWLIGALLALALVGAMNRLGWPDGYGFFRPCCFADFYFITLFGLVFSPILVKDIVSAFREWWKERKIVASPNRREVN